VSRQIDVALPFWLDRPDDEALDIALATRDAGLGTLWIGEMATYDTGRRIGAYFDAGADVVGVVPSTAEDPSGHRVLSAVCRTRTEELAP